MSSVARSVLGAALLLTGASAAMAQSANTPVANQTVQTSVSAPAAAPNNSATIVASNNAPIVDQSQKPRSNVGDNTDRYGGHDPNSTAGSRAFWEALNPY
jgi:hypothetical protein